MNERLMSKRISIYIYINIFRDIVIAVKLSESE